jgi:hypothetical protein
MRQCKQGNTGQRGFAAPQHKTEKETYSTTELKAPNQEETALTVTTLLTLPLLKSELKTSTFAASSIMFRAFRVVRRKERHEDGIATYGDEGPYCAYTLHSNLVQQLQGNGTNIPGINDKYNLLPISSFRPHFDIERTPRDASWPDV